MATDLASVLKDAGSFQKGLNAFDSTDFSKQCPSTELIYKDVVNPDEVDEPLPDGGPIDSSITVRDYCTDEVIPGAVVTLNGITYTANADGFVYLGLLPAGATLPVAITATGYIDNDLDTLPNDSITIPQDAIP